MTISDICCTHIRYNYVHKVHYNIIFITYKDRKFIKNNYCIIYIIIYNNINTLPPHRIKRKTIKTLQTYKYSYINI